MTVHRPGPERLEPHLAPDGVVVHVYDRTGRLLLVRNLTPGEPDADARAEADAEFACAIAAGDLCIVAYDGDTGQRMTPDDIIGPT